MKRNRPFILTGLSLLVSLAVLGCRDVATPTKGSDVAYTVLPGDSTDLANPCPPGTWADANSSGTPGDTFALPPVFDKPIPPSGLSVNTTVASGTVKRQLVATKGVDLVFKLQVPYDYHTFVAESGTCSGNLIVSTVTQLAASASAQPATITAGNTSQLSVTVTGGAQPYSFAWTPSTSLSDPTILNPVATPGTTTTYTVTVTDSTTNMAQTATAPVTVTVGSSQTTKELDVFAPPGSVISVTAESYSCVAVPANTATTGFCHTHTVSVGTKVVLNATFATDKTGVSSWGITNGAGQPLPCDTATNDSCTFNLTTDSFVHPVLH